MSPRPRTASDADLLDATARTVSKLGPIRFTLADVGKEAGVVPATLIQRFGSKRGLLLALAREGSSATTKEMIAIGGDNAPLASLRAYAECVTGMAPTPEELAHHLTFLVMDLTDPEFRELAVTQMRASENEMTSLVESAVESGELKPCDPRRLARLIQEMLHGALVNWAIHRQGTARAWVSDQFEALIAPYLVVEDEDPSGE